MDEIEGSIDSSNSLLKCKHQCHCACSSEIGTCIINDAGRQAAQKTHRKSFILVSKVNINLQSNKKKFNKIYQTQQDYTFDPGYDLEILTAAGLSIFFNSTSTSLFTGNTFC